MIFEEIYDSLFTIIEAALPNRLELVNPYDIEDNNGLWLKSGYGVEVGSGSITDAFNRQIRQFQRTITITLTGRDVATDKKTITRRAVEKQLVSDQLILITAMKNGLPSDFVQLVGDEGIQYVYTERQDLIRLRTNFLIHYNEQVR